MPVIFCPSSRVAQRASSFSFLSASATTLIEPTALLLAGLTSITLNFTSLSLRVSRSSFLLKPVRDAGTKILVPFVVTRTPPRIVWVTTPSRISSDSLAATMSFQPFDASKRRFESLRTPSWSSVFIMIRLISSPTATTSSHLLIGSAERSSNATTPVCFLPGTSTKTSVGVMLRTVPVTTLLVSFPLKDSLSNSSKDASPSADASTAGFTSAVSAVSAVSTTSSATAEVVSTSFSLISSDMVLSTSLIITEGVEAPAVTPTTLQSEKSMSFNSSAVSIRYDLQFAELTSLSLQVLDEWRPPIMTIASAEAEISAASLCLSDVALHIVSKILQFVHTFFSIFSHFFHSFFEKVV